MEYNIPVVVPDLGCFTIVNIPSEIRDGRVIPPFKTVKLDSENTIDDGVLTSYLAIKENITIERAADEIRKFYHQNFINKLPLSKNIVFEKFGAFSLNEFNDIVFNPDPEFFKDNYGLDYAFFSGNTHQQPQETPVAPEPEPFFTPQPEPVFTPQPEPGFTPQPEPGFTPQPESGFAFEPEPIFTPEPEPVFASEPVQTPPPPYPNPENSLFDTNDSSRFRENTTRSKRPPMFENEPFVRPASRAKIPPVPKKPKQKTKTGSSNIWVLWVLLAAAGLGFAVYYFYPTIHQKFFSPNTTITSLENLGNETIPLDNAEPEEEIPNAELAQTLDDATDKKNALNPESSQQTEASTSQSQTQLNSQSNPAVVPSTPSATEQKPASVTQSVGQGRYVLVIASFKSHSEAERHSKRLQASEGIGFEIIPATVNGALWNRVSAGSYDTLAEAKRQANQMKSNPSFKDVWVTKR